VGPKRKSFKIHKKLLLAKSRYWQAHQGSLEEDAATDFYVRQDPDSFAVVFGWLYREKMSPFPGTGSQAILSAVQQSEVVLKLFTVYRLAQEMGIPKLMDLVMNQIGTIYYANMSFPTSDEIAAVYENTASGCGLRRYMARSFNIMLLRQNDGDGGVRGGIANCRDFVNLAIQLKELHEDSLQNLRGMLIAGHGAAPHGENVCDYHQHGEAETCFFKGKRFQGKQAPVPTLQVLLLILVYLDLHIVT
jgi:hypothetical protein